MTDNLQKFYAEMAESQAKLIAERDKDPLQAAMAKAYRRTREESAAIADAERRVDEAKAAVNAAGWALARAERGNAPERSQGFAFFKKSKDAHRQAAAAATTPGLRADHEEARQRHQNATRRLNDTVRTIDLARGERRAAAKAAKAPKREKPVLRGRVGLL